MGYRILVIEDSPTQAERIRFLLEEAGHTVEVAPNGREGLKRLGATAPQLIVSDIEMPLMDGFAFCHAVKADATTRTIPVVLLTSHHTPADIIRGLEVGADNFIAKPFEDGHLLARIARIFENLAHRERGGLEMEVSVRVGGREIVVNADKQQMIELLFSTSEELSESNRQLEHARSELEEHARGLERKVEERTREVAESRRFLERVVAAVPGIVYILDLKERRFSYVSAQVELVLGYAPKQIQALGVSAIEQFVHPEDWPRLLESQAGGNEPADSEVSQGSYRVKDSSGVWHWLSLRQAAFDRRDGELSQVLGIAIDVTEQRRTEEMLQQSQRLDSVGRLAGGIAHDFNNLLGVITGYGELTRRQLPPEHEVQPRLEQMLKAAERAAGLTRQLLAFGRKQIMQPHTLDLNAVVVDLDKMLRRVLGEDVELVVETTTDLARIKADPTQLEQILMNLVINARDAMPRGGHLRIETMNADFDAQYAAAHPPAQPGKYAMLAVSDTGMGMDAETQRRMFDPFFTTKAAGEGTGLGLATVYGIVKQNAGYIWVYSEPGHGTTFKVYWPRVDEPVEPRVAPAPAAAPQGGHETVLVVEDTEELRALICELLEEMGYTVLPAGGGDQALALSSEHKGPIHLLLTDVVMPGMGGPVLAKDLALTRPEIRVLYMSGYTNGVISKHGIAEHGIALLEKPFTAERLGQAVREALSAPSPS
jgi:two-component system cell cycle sensor histidine kinase/response regulator CckA